MHNQYLHSADIAEWSEFGTSMVGGTFKVKGPCILELYNFVHDDIYID
jgi:hypothetical protein